MHGARYENDVSDGCHGVNALGAPAGMRSVGTQCRSSSDSIRVTVRITDTDSFSKRVSEADATGVADFVA
jgi:hypothetical protein